MKHIILSLIQSDRDPTEYDDIDKNILIGQPWINIFNETYYICIENNSNNAVWKKLTFNFSNDTNIRIGITNCLGDSKNKYINTNLPKSIDYCAITPLEYTNNNLGTVFCDFQNNILIVRNTGTYNKKICWFVTGNDNKKISLVLKSNGGIIYDLINNINCNNYNEYLFDANTNINLSFINDDNYIFSLWKTFNNIIPQNFILTEDTLIEAVFIPREYQLTISPTQNCNILSNDNRIDCGFTCDSLYNINDEITLQCFPHSGYIFERWGGDITSLDNPYTFLISSNMTVYPILRDNTFIDDTNLINYTLIINNNSNIGIVKTLDNEIHCGIICEKQYLEGSSITLIAIPSQHAEFDYWSGDIQSDVDTINFLILNNISITPNFKLKKYKLILLINGNGYITGDIQTNSNIELEFDYSTVVELIANSFDDSTFVEFSGSINSINNNLTITITGDLTITCFFKLKKCEITLYNPNFAQIKTLNNDINTTNDISVYNYKYGDKLYLTAIPNVGQLFLNWTIDGHIINTSDLFLFLYKNFEIFVNFNDIQYLVSIVNFNNGNVYSDDNYIHTPIDTFKYYTYNTQIVLTATPNIGYKFMNWSGDIVSNDNPLSINITNNLDMHAIFDQIFYLLNIQIHGNGQVNTFDNKINCPTICQFNYPGNETVTLIATPDSGNVLFDWIGGNEIDINKNCIVNMTDNKTIEAIFIPIPDVVSYGYVCGGQSGPFLNSNIERFVFPFNYGDTTSMNGSLTTEKRELCGNNSSTFFYVCGGNKLYGSNRSEIERFNFTLTTGISTLYSNLSQQKSKLSGLNSISHGYCCGGAQYASDYILYKHIEKFSFSVASTTIIANNLTIVKDATSASNSSNYGYVCGGWVANGNIKTSIERFLFLLDNSPMTIQDNLTESLCETSANNSSIYSYVYGGTYWASSGIFTNKDIVNRFTFPLNGSSCANINTLSSVRGSTSSNNSSQYGYICGGYNIFNLRLIDQLNFSLDGAIINNIANLSATKYATAATDGTDFTNLFI